MKFLCDRCKTRYSITDEKVRGKVLKIRCKTCSAVITVREGGAAVTEGGVSGRTPPPETVQPPLGGAGLAPATPKAPALEAAFGRAMAQPAPRAASPRPGAKPLFNDDEATRLSDPPKLDVSDQKSKAPPLPADNGVEWFVSIDGDQEGPFTLVEAQRRVAKRKGDEELHAWQEGFDDWLPVEDIPALAKFLPKAAPPVPVKPPLPSAAMRGGNGSSNGNGAAVAASSLAATPAAPPVPAVAAAAGKGKPVSMAALASSAPAAAEGEGGDNFDFDIGEASRVVKLPMLMPPGAQGNATPVGGRAGTGGLPGMGGAPAPVRRTQAIVVPASMAAAVASASALAEEQGGTIPPPVEAPRKRGLAMFLVGGGVLAAFLVVLLVVMLKQGGGEAATASGGSMSTGVDIYGTDWGKLPDEVKQKQAGLDPSNPKVPRTPRPATPNPKNPSNPGANPGTPSVRDPGEDIFGTPTGVGERQVEEVLAARQRYGSTLQQCFERALKLNPDLKGKGSRFDVALTITAAGQVRNVSVKGPDRDLQECVKARVSSWTFKAASNDAPFQFPVVFN